MGVNKSEYYLERKVVIELYFRDGQFVDAEREVMFDKIGLQQD